MGHDALQGKGGQVELAVCRSWAPSGYAEAGHLIDRAF